MKSVFVIMTIGVVLVSMKANGQIPDMLWHKTLNPACGTLIYSILPLQDGTFYLSGTTNIPNYGEFFSGRISATGDSIWTNKIYFTGIQAYRDGRAVMDGSGNMISAETHVRGWCYVIVLKTLPNGDTAWTKWYNALPLYPFGQAIAKSTAGGYLIGGNISKTELGDSNQIFLLRLDDNCDKLWQKNIGTPWKYTFNDLISTRDGGFLMCASTTESTIDGKSDIWVVKYDQNGTQVWARSYGSSGDEIGYTLTLRSDNGFYLVGSCPTPSNAQGKDAWLLSLTANGDSLWSRKYGSSGDDTPQALGVDSADNCILLYTYNKTIARASIPFSRIVSTSPSGMKLWENELEFGYKCLTVLGPNIIMGGYDTAYCYSALIAMLAPNGPPHFTTLATSFPDTINEDTLFTKQLAAKDTFPGEILKFSLTPGFPNGMKIDSLTGVLSWKPDDPDVGTHKLVAVVTDKVRQTDTLKFSLTVRNVNDPPVITGRNPSSPMNVAKGDSMPVSVSDTDQDNDHLTYSWFVNNVAAGTDSIFPYHAGMWSQQVDTVVVKVSDGKVQIPNTWVFSLYTRIMPPMLVSPRNYSIVRTSSSLVWTRTNEADMKGLSPQYRVQIFLDPYLKSIAAERANLSDSTVPLSNFQYKGGALPQDTAIYWQVWVDTNGVQAIRSYLGRFTIHDSSSGVIVRPVSPRTKVKMLLARLGIPGMPALQREITSHWRMEVYNIQGKLLWIGTDASDGGFSSTAMIHSGPYYFRIQDDIGRITARTMKVR
jgi:hypothetical protein